MSDPYIHETTAQARERRDDARDQIRIAAKMMPHGFGPKERQQLADALKVIADQLERLDQ